jgi:WD40 repeat protein/serine/threonine protein kinase
LTDSTKSCPDCGAELPANAPEGLCLRCLAAFAAGFASSDPPARLPTASRCWDYELLEEIARGGMGVIYRARQVSLNRTVAVKMLLFGQFASEEFVKRFHAEAQAAASLHHPNIVAIHEIGKHDGLHYFAMDYVPGHNLADLVRESPLPSRRAAGYLQTIAAAVHYAHEYGVLHRDLKPSNVLIDESDQPRVTDFGLAKQLHDDQGITTTGHVLGSPSYLSPEQAMGRRAGVGVCSDVYSLGAMLYHVLTGRPPFVGESIPETLHQVVHNEPVSPRLLNPSVPRDLETICLKCLEKTAERRYASAQALAEDLQRFQAGEPILARPLSPPQWFGRWCRRKPALASSFFLLIILAAGATWSALEFRRKNEQQRKYSYVSDMRLALDHFREGYTVDAWQLLKFHLPANGQSDLRGFEWRYLIGQCRGDYSYSLPRHAQIVGELRYSPDGRLMAAYTWNKVLTVWELAARKPRFQATNVSGFGGFTLDGQAVVISRGTNSLQMCATQTGHTNQTIPVQGELVAYAPVSHTAVIVSQEAGLSLVDLTNGQVRFALPEFTRAKLSFGLGFPGALSPNGELLALVKPNSSPLRNDVAIQLYNVRTGKLQRQFPVDCQIRSLIFSPDGSVLAVGDGKGYLLLWNLRDPENPPLVRKAHDSPVLSLAFSPDGKTLATGGADLAGIHLWNVADGTPKSRVFRGQIGDAWSLAFSPDGRNLASGTRDDVVRVWDLEKPEPLEIVEENVFAHEYGNFVFSPDSRFMAAGCTGAVNKVEVWEVASLRRHAVFTNMTYVVAFSGDGRRILVSTSGGVPHWENLDSTAAAREIPSYRGKLEDMTAVDLTPDRTVSALGLRSGVIGLFEIESGRPVGPALQLHQDAIRSLAFSPDGNILASGGDDKGFFVSDLRTGKEVGHSFEHKGSVCAVAISPDGQTLASGCAAETVKLWHLTSITNGSIASFSYHKSVIRTLAFSPDGRTLASGSEDNTVKLWSVPMRKEVASFKLEAPLRLVLFAPDGNALATVTDRGSLRIYRAPDMRQADEMARQ